MQNTGKKFLAVFLPFLSKNNKKIKKLKKLYSLKNPYFMGF